MSLKITNNDFIRFIKRFFIEREIKIIFLFCRRYFVVGLMASITHFIVQATLEKFILLPLSNLAGFFSASLISYLGHSLFTFRKATTGRLFAKRWFFIQFITNILLSLILPIFLQRLGFNLITRTFMYCSPSIVNAIVWLKASNYSRNKLNS